MKLGFTYCSCFIRLEMHPTVFCFCAGVEQEKTAQVRRRYFIAFYTICQSYSDVIFRALGQQRKLSASSKSNLDQRQRRHGSRGRTWLQTQVCVYQYNPWFSFIHLRFLGKYMWLGESRTYSLSSIFLENIGQNVTLSRRKTRRTTMGRERLQQANATTSHKK